MGVPTKEIDVLLTAVRDTSNNVLNGGLVYTFTGGMPNFTTTGTITSGSNQLTSLSSTTGIIPGMTIWMNGVPTLSLPTTVLTVDTSTSTVTMSANATASASGASVTFGTTLSKAWTVVNRSSTASNPITLDSNGRALVYADGYYRLIVQSATAASTTGTITAGSTTLTVSSATGITTGMYIWMDDVPYLTTVSSIVGTTITMSNAAVVTHGGGGVAVTFATPIYDWDNLFFGVSNVVNVCSFGAVGDGIADDTTAIQAAIDYAQSTTPQGAVFLPGNHLVTKSIYINRPLNQTNELMIFGNGSGSGIFVTNTGSYFNIFDSNLDFSEEVTFKDLRFYTLHADTVKCRVLSPAFLRIQFINCFFEKMKLIYNSTSFLETFRFLNCTVRDNDSTDGTTAGNRAWIDTAGNFDVSFEGCIFENNSYLFRSIGSGDNGGTNGFRFINNSSDSASGSTLILNGCRGVEIVGNYFKSTGDIDIDLSQGSNTNITITIEGNYFLPSSGKSCIYWGNSALNGTSIGNVCWTSGAYLHKNVSSVTNFTSEGDSVISGATLSDAALPTQIGGIQSNSGTVSSNALLGAGSLTASVASSRVAAWVSGSIPILTLTNSSASSGSRNWDLRNSSGTLIVAQSNDGYSSSATQATFSSGVLDLAGSLNVNGGSLYVNGDISQANGAGTTIGKVWNDSGYYSLRSDSSNVFGLKLDAPGSSQGIHLWTNGSERLTISSAGVVTTPGTYSNTSGSAANVYIDSSGILYRSTSSLEYKKDIKSDVNSAILDSLKPITYASKDENNPSNRHYGFIAEDIESVEPRLVQHTLDGKPDGVQYDRLTVLLVKRFQELKAQLDELKADFKEYKRKHH